jgi:hypothetical protein
VSLKGGRLLLLLLNGPAELEETGKPLDEKPVGWNEKLDKLDELVTEALALNDALPENEDGLPENDELEPLWTPELDADRDELDV